MNVVLDNDEWKLRNDKFRSPKSREPDVYYIGPAKANAYVIIADGWEAPSKRHHIWIPVPPDIVRPREIDEFGRNEAAKLAALRGLSLAGAEGDGGKSSTAPAARKQKGDVTLEVALNEIEADQTAGVNDRTGDNTKAGCRVIRDGLPPERLPVPVRRLTPKEFEREIKRTIAEDPDLTVATKRHYLSQARTIAHILVKDYGLDNGCIAALKTPSKMTGADSDERPFRLPDVHAMENQIEGEKITTVLGEWTDTIQGAYYGGTNCAFQPVDLAFLKWCDMDKDLKFIDGRRFKTSIPFFIVISKRFRRWLLRRRAKGGIWAEGYIFPELIFGIRACRKSTGPLRVLASKKEEKIATNVTNRLRDYFNKFLDNVCEIKRPGISYKSFRHYILPYLRSQNVPAEVGKDIAGQVTLEAYLGYGGHGTHQQQMRATGLLEQHFLNVKEGKNESIILTHRELAQYLAKVQLKGLKKLLLAYQDGTAHVIRNIDRVATSQAKGFELLNTKLDTLRAELQQLRNLMAERAIGTGAQIGTIAPLQGPCCRDCGAKLQAENTKPNPSSAWDMHSYSI